MILPFTQRISVAAEVVFRGWHSMFNRVQSDGAGGPTDKLNSPYKESVWVMAAIRCVAQPIAAVPLVFSQGEQKLLDPALTEFWRQPAVGLTWPEFVRASVGWLKMSGECFWVLGDEWLVPFPAARACWPKMLVARPDQMTELLEAGEIVGWRFTDRSGKQQVLLPEQVIHLRCWNPASDYRGQGELDPARVAADADYLAGKFNLNLMRNNGDRGAYVICKSGIPDDDQRKQIIAQLQQKRLDAQRGNFRPAFLTGDFTIEDPKIQSLDANVIASRLQNRHEIYIAFGVPPSMADIAASYSIGSASDRFRLIEDTCMPIGADICGGIAQVLQRMGKPGITAALSWEDHSVMLQVRAERITTARQLWDMGMPVEKINDYLRLKMPEFEGWDTGYLPFGLSPTSEVAAGLGNPQTAPGFGENGTNGTDASPAKVLRALFAGQVARAPKRDPREIARWKEMMAKRRTTIRAYKSKFDRLLMRARSETLGKIAAAPVSLKSGPQTQTRSVAADLIFDFDEFEKGLVAGMRQVAKNGLLVAGQQLMKEIGRDDPWKMADPKVLEFLAKRDNLIKDCAAETYQDIKDELAAGLDAGETMAQLADRVRGAFNDISSESAERIAMTETSAVYGEARQEALQDAGIEFKEWLTSGNENVRPAHQEANGQIVRVDDPFSVMDENLMQPGDSDGSPENIINCHCIAVASEKGPTS